VKALAIFVIILLVGGAFSSGLIPSAPVLTQSIDPNASVMAVTSEQANQLVFWVIFVLVNVIGVGVTIAVLIWLGSRAVKNAKAMPKASATTSEQLPESAT